MGKGKNGAQAPDEKFPSRLTGEGVVHGTAKTDSPPGLVLLRQALYAWHWSGYKRAFDVAHLLCGNDAQWQVAHKFLMDIAAEQERSLHTIVERIGAQAIQGKQEVKA